MKQIHRGQLYGASGTRRTWTVQQVALTGQDEWTQHDTVQMGAGETQDIFTPDQAGVGFRTVLERTGAAGSTYDTDEAEAAGGLDLLEFDYSLQGPVEFARDQTEEAEGGVEAPAPVDPSILFPPTFPSGFSIQPWGWWRASEIVGLTDQAALGGWPDISGNARHLASMVPGVSNPEWRAAAASLNNQPYVTHNGDGSLAITGTVADESTVTLSGELTIFVAYVSSIVEPSALHHAFGNKTNSFNRGLSVAAPTSGAFWCATSVDAVIGSGADKISNVLSAAAGNIAIVRRAANNDWSVFFNGADETVSPVKNHGGTVIFNALFLCGSLTGSTSPQDMGIAELVIFNGFLADSDMKRLYNYGAERYGKAQVTS
jgi:hypothetical protein